MTKTGMTTEMRLAWSMLLAGAATHAAVVNTTCVDIARVDSLPTACRAPTWSLDEPCPKCFINSAPDYPGGGVAPSASLLAAMSTQLEQYLAYLLEQRPPANYDGSSTVFQGVGGRALLFLKLFEHTHNATHLDIASQYLATALKHLPEQEALDKLQGLSGFQWSSIGVHCVAAVILTRQNNPSKAAEHIGAVKQAVESQTGRYDDFDSGRSGLLFATYFLEKALNQTLFDRQAVVGLANAIISRGAELATPDKDYLQWHGPNDSGLWLGQSHGSAGVIQQLLGVPEVLSNATAVEWIKKTLNHIVSVQFPSGNFPAEYYNSTQDVLVQWDHGAPGVSACLVTASLALKEPSYMESAEKALECVWKRGLLYKGLMNCHGIGGTTYMQLHAYTETKNQTYLYRALQFQEFVIGNPFMSNLATMRVPQPSPQGEWAFWTGSIESAAILWTDFVYPMQEGTSSFHLTGWSPQF